MSYPTYLIHYGITGQKWGVRRYQNEDGSLTPEGYEHYGREKAISIEQKNLYKQLKKSGFSADARNNVLFNKLVKSNKKYSERKDKIKTLSDERDRLHSEIKNSKPNKHDEDSAKELFWSIHGHYPNLNSKKDKKALKLDMEAVMAYNASHNKKIVDIDNEIHSLIRKNAKDHLKVAKNIAGKYGNKKVKVGKGKYIYYDQLVSHYL